MDGPNYVTLSKSRAKLPVSKLRCLVEYPKIRAWQISENSVRKSLEIEMMGQLSENSSLACLRKFCLKIDRLFDAGSNLRKFGLGMSPKILF